MTLLLMAASATVGALFGALAVGIAAMSAGRCRHCDEESLFRYSCVCALCSAEFGGVAVEFEKVRCPNCDHLQEASSYQRVSAFLRPAVDVNREALGQ